MAVFKQIMINEKTGLPCDYKTEEDIRGVVAYAMRSSVYTISSWVALIYPECAANQIIACQRCRGRDITKRMLQFTLSFYTDGYERFVSKDTIIKTMQWLNAMFFPDNQKILCLHVNERDHLHIHMLVNPVRLDNCNIEGYYLKRMMYELAEYLGGFHGIALQGVSYQDTNGIIRKGSELGRDLYQKNWYEENGFRKVI